MQWRKLPVRYISFKRREQRANYICQTYSSFLQQSILDVGCWEADLRNALNGSSANYTGIDFAGKPDICVNLEQVEKLPFEDNTFDCVVCTDVLEHLSNLHTIASELVRVSNRYLIVSLPNNWVNARVPIARGRGSFDKYGLPLEAPADRHKWFFSLSEARDFLENYAKKYNLKIVDLSVTEKPRPLIVRLGLLLRNPSQETYLNRYAHTIWAVFEKNS